jgi:hypothetical protein
MEIKNFKTTQRGLFPSGNQFQVESLIENSYRFSLLSLDLGQASDVSKL